MELFTNQPDFATWLIALARIQTELDVGHNLTEESIRILPTAPRSRDLLALADPPDREVYRSDLIEHARGFICELGLAEPTLLDFAWIALWSTFDPSDSADAVLEHNEDRWRLQLGFPAIRKYTMPFLAARDELDEGADKAAILPSILDAVESTRPRFLVAFRDYLDSVDASWVRSSLRL